MSEVISYNLVFSATTLFGWTSGRRLVSESFFFWFTG